MGAVNVGYPNKMSSALGKDVRTGVHPCFDRLVIELQPGTNPIPGGLPGYYVRYVNGTNVLLDPSGQMVTIKGNAVVLVSLGVWMKAMDNSGYQGPRDVFPTNVASMKELRLIEDFEGQSTWAVGLDAKRNFTVFTLTAPDRLVVDFQTAP